jgi:beta-glucosidase
LPDGQDALIAAVTAANPNTVVVLETGGAVLMPWLDATRAVVAAWYPGERGGEAIANVLFGAAEPAGRLPVTFPASESQLPRPKIPGWGLPRTESFAVDYREGADIGYRWFARRKLEPLFPFGYGLSYTTFDYSGLKITGAHDLVATFEVRNTGKRAGYAVPQVYLTGAAERPERRLVAWAKVLLQPGEKKRLTAPIDARLLAEFDATASKWRVAAGSYEFSLGDSAEHFAEARSSRLPAATLPP